MIMQNKKQFFEGTDSQRKRHCACWIVVFWICGLLFGGICAAQQPDAPAPQPAVLAKQAQATAASSPAPGAPVRLTLQDALALARKNEPTYQSVVTDAGVARENRAQTRDANGSSSNRFSISFTGPWEEALVIAMISGSKNVGAAVLARTSAERV